MRPNLYCLPYAGGSASIYHRWTRQPTGHARVIPLELPGRGGRFSEPFLDDLQHVVGDVVDAIDRYDNSGGIALFGYSMGSLIAFETALRLEERGTDVAHVFLAAMGSPLSHSRRRTFDLPERDFLTEVQSLGGTPSALFEDPDLRDIFVRILRNDFKVVETYRPDHGRRLRHTDVTVIFGTDDHEVVPHAAAWEQLTDGHCSLFAYPGDHFFIRDHGDALLGLVQARLTAHHRLQLLQAV